jgi:acyl-CoA thioesterase YciA
MSEIRETTTHRLILPREANHHGTLYAGSLVSLALEAAYATGYRAIGDSANLVLKRVVDLRCIEPVPIGEVVEIRGSVLMMRSAQMVVGLYGSPLKSRKSAWMDALMQFVQIDVNGRPFAFDDHVLNDFQKPDSEPWIELTHRLERLLKIRRNVNDRSKYE